MSKPTDPYTYQFYWKCPHIKEVFLVLGLHYDVGMKALYLVVLLASCSDSPIEDLPANPITYYEDVAPITMEKCVVCHHADEATRVAPFSLASFADAFAIGQTGLMSHVVQNRIMPPWQVNNDGDCNTFKDSLWLDEIEIQQIAGWVDGGMLEGDPANGPALPEPIAPMTTQTHTVSMDGPYTPTDPLTDDYRCFVVDAGEDQDKFLVAQEFESSNYSVSHHAILFALDSDEAGAQAQALDEADPGQGYPCFGGPGVAGASPIGLWAPGTGSTLAPEGTGIKIPGGRVMVLQMHFNYTNERTPAEVSVKLELVDEVNKEAYLYKVSDNTIDLEPGMELVNSFVDDSVPAAMSAATIWGVMPHMHSRGQDMSVSLSSSSGESCVAEVENWSFEWQRAYWYDEPFTVQGGDTLSIRCGFSTAGDTERVVFGEGSADEMCMSYFYVTL